MNPDFAILLFLFGISATVNIGLIIAWLSARKRLRMLESRPIDPSVDELVARVESAVDTVNARLDDLVSSQDFMNRILTDRLDRIGRALPEPEPHDTPL
jgi:hypothetical protein